MVNALPGGGLFLPSSDVVQRGISLPLLANRFGVARVFCALALLALLFSTVSPIEGWARPDLSRHRRSGHRAVSAPEQARASQSAKAVIGAAVRAEVRADAWTILHAADGAPVIFPAGASSPGCERTHGGRAPPISS